MNYLEKILKLDLKKIVFYTFIFILIFSIAATCKYYDTDLWTRLIVGKAFWQSGTILKKDFLSFLPTNVWIDHEWGSGVIFYAFYKLFSYHGFIILHSLLTFFTFVFIQKTLKLKGITNFSILFFTVAIFAFLDTNNFVVRCQSITFLFFTAYVYIFEQARLGNRKYLWLTPFSMLFWCNIHGGCVSGIGLFFIYILGEFLNKKDFKYFILPFGLNIAVLLVNPWGIEYLIFLLYANTLNRIWVVEWYNLFNTTLFLKKYIFIKLFVIMSLFTEIFYIKKADKRDWTKIILTLTTIIMGIQHIKLLPFAVITVSVFFYKEITDFFNNLFCKINNYNIQKYSKMFIYACILSFIIYSLNEYKFEPFTGTFYPYKTAEYIKINKLEGMILCDFSTGSFLEYKLYPQNKIYMDGRYEELFKFQDLANLMFFLYAKTDYNKLLNKYPINIIIARNGYTIVENLIKSKNWTPIFYEDDFVTLSKNEYLKNSYIDPPEDIDYYKKTLFDTDINFMIKSKRNERK